MMLDDLPYLWHLVPHRMMGEHLLPLKALLAQYPKIGAAQAAKYRGREAITTWRVPMLDCGWHEVIFLSPIHPRYFTEALRAAQVPITPWRAYQIPATALAQHEAVWFDPQKSGKPGGPTAESIAPWHAETYRSLPLSDACLPYYRETIRAGHRPLLFATEKHVLLRGFHRDGTPHPLSIAQAEMIAV